MRLVSGGVIPQAVSLDEFKRAIHMLVDDADDDQSLTAYLQTAQEVVETACNRPLGARDVVMDLPLRSVKRWWFPVAPVGKLISITSVAGDGTETAKDISLVGLELQFDEPRLYLPSDFLTWDKPEMLRITATVGETTIPTGMKQAIILLAREWYLAGIALDTVTPASLTLGPVPLVAKYRYSRPKEYEEFKVDPRNPLVNWSEFYNGWR